MAAGRAEAGSARKRCRMPGRSRRASTPETSSPVKTWVATKRPSAAPRRSFWCGMIAVCGIGMPSGWRNRAVTANQSAMPPTKPAFDAACSRSVQVDGGKRVGGQRQHGHPHQEGGGEQTVVAEGAASLGVRVGKGGCHTGRHPWLGGGGWQGVVGGGVTVSQETRAPSDLSRSKAKCGGAGRGETNPRDTSSEIVRPAEADSGVQWCLRRVP